MPTAHSLSHRSQRLSTDPRREVHVDPTNLVDRLSRPERIAEECELDYGVCCFPIHILAVHYPRLLRMQFKPALTEPLSKFPQHQQCLRFALAVDDTIVSISTESNAG